MLCGWYLYNVQHLGFKVRSLSVSSASSVSKERFSSLIRNLKVFVFSSFHVAIVRVLNTRTAWRAIPYNSWYA